MPNRTRRAGDPPDPKRETRPPALNSILDALQGSWSKIAILFLGVLIALWGAFRFDDRIDQNSAGLEKLQTRVTRLTGSVDNLESGVRSAARELGHINVLLGDLADIRDELVNAVKDARGR